MFHSHASRMLCAACLLSTFPVAHAQQAQAAGPVQSVTVVSQRNPSTWFKAESRHFVVYSDTDHPEATRLLDNLERLDYLLRAYTKGYDKTANDERKLTLYYAARVEDFNRIGLGQPADAVGLYSSCAAGVQGFAVQLHAIEDLAGATLAKVPLDDSLSHIFEAYARHFLYRHTDIRAPLWFIDGFAQYFSSIRFTDTQLVVGRTPPALGDYLRFIDDGHRHSLDYRDVLEQNDSRGNNYAREAGVRLEFEARSWRLVHYIMSTENNRRNLRAYLKAFYDGAPPVQAFETSFGIKVADLSTTMWRYGLQSSEVLTVDQPALPHAVVDFTGLPQAAGEFVLLDAALQSCPGKEAGARLLAAVRAEAARQPNDATGQLALSRAEIAAGDGARALPYLDKALARDEANAGLHLLAGQAHLRMAEQDAAGRTAHLAEAQRQLARARELDPQGAGVALAVLHADMIGAGTPSQAALDGVLAAWRGARDVGALGKSAALAYAWMGDGISAANVLKSMASNLRDPEGAAWAANWSRRLDKGLTRTDLQQGLRDDPWTGGAFREWAIAHEDVMQRVVTNAGLDNARHAITQTLDAGTGQVDTPIPANR